MTAERIKNTYDWDKLTVTREGNTFALADLSQTQRDQLALHGLANKLSGAEMPVSWFADIKSGERSLVREGKSETLDPWREAAAIVHAEASCRARGIKSLPGKKFREAPEFLAALVSARQAAAGWSKLELAQAKTHAHVVAEHATLTGKKADLGALFAAPVELAEAAD